MVTVPLAVVKIWASSALVRLMPATALLRAADAHRRDSAATSG